jgi:hypothetical protein
MADQKDIDRYLANLSDERNSAAMYKALAEAEENPKLAQVDQKLSDTEQGHAEAWAERLQTAGARVLPFRPAWRTRMLIWLSRRLGAQAVLPTLASIEQTSSHGYSRQPEAGEMAGTESMHARLLQQISQSTRGGMEGGVLAQRKGGTAQQAAMHCEQRF